MADGTGPGLDGQFLHRTGTIFTLAGVDGRRHRFESNPCHVVPFADTARPAGSIVTGGNARSRTRRFARSLALHSISSDILIVRGTRKVHGVSR